MKLNSIRVKLIISGIYVLLLGSLLLSMTLGKYQDTKIAYASFGAASFNTVILGENQLVEVKSETDDEDDTTAQQLSNQWQWNDDGEVNEFGIALQTADYMPGMVWDEDDALNTAEEFPFCVANGRSLDYASEASVEYYIRLRTLNSLPLDYTLTYTTMRENISIVERYITAEPTVITVEETGDTWYEYSFYIEDEDDSALLDEALFTIYGGTLGMNEHSLILEWPSEGDANDVKYMKELENLQILVTTSSKNMLTEEDYMGNVDGSVTYTPTGRLILDPATGQILSDGSNVYTYTYEIDYRSFTADDTQQSFLLTVDNGVRPDGQGGNNGIDHPASQSTYTVWLKVPYSGSDNYTYSFYTDVSGESTPFTLFEYRLYDIKTGTYESSRTDPTAEGESLDGDLYVIYCLMDGGAYTTIPMYYNYTLAGNSSYIYDVNNHKISITTAEGYAPSDEELTILSWEDSLELWIENTYSD